MEDAKKSLLYWGLKCWPRKSVDLHCLIIQYIIDQMLFHMVDSIVFMGKLSSIIGNKRFFPIVNWLNKQINIQRRVDHWLLSVLIYFYQSMMSVDWLFNCIPLCMFHIVESLIVLFNLFVPLFFIFVHSLWNLLNLSFHCLNWICQWSTYCVKHYVSIKMTLNLHFV